MSHDARQVRGGQSGQFHQRIRFSGLNSNCLFVCLWLLAVVVFAGWIPQSNGQAETPNAATSPEQDAAKVKAKWVKALQEARRDFQNNNDRESAAFVEKMLQSVEQPNGMSSEAIAAYGESMKKKVRELVASGALESAACLNWTQWRVLYMPGAGKDGPSQPNSKTGGAAGPDGLVLYLSFDEPDKDGVVRDASGAGNEGRVYGAKWVPEGRIGGAYKFNITNLADRIVIPNSDSLNPDFITVAAWIKTADTDGFWNRILDKDFRNSYCLGLGGDWNGKAARGKLLFETSAGTADSSSTLTDNKWHHVAATFDGKSVHCYIDGVERGHPIKNPRKLKKSTWDLCIGNSVVDYGTGEFIAFDGLIDEVRIYNCALPVEKIKALATVPLAGVKPSTQPVDGGPKAAPAERLKQLKSLLEQGLIDKENYDRKVKEVMDSI